MAMAAGDAKLGVSLSCCTERTPSALKSPRARGLTGPYRGFMHELHEHDEHLSFLHRHEHIILSCAKVTKVARRMSAAKRHLAHWMSFGHVADLLVTMDPGQDLDDEMFLVMLRGLVDQGLVRCAGVVTTLAPAQMRARLAKGTLDELGLGKVPVAFGSDGGAQGDTASMQDLPYMGPEVTTTGEELMKRVLDNAKPRSITFVVISSLKDAAAFLKEHPGLFKAKVKLACIMGGIEPIPPDAKGEIALRPDTAHNNMFDFESAKFFYARCQELGVPLRVVSRFAAYGCPVPRSIYDEMAGLGSPIGRHLQQVQAGSIERLWQRACAPEGSAERAGLPARCNREWFCDTFCGGKGKERDGSQSIWDLIRTFNMYDPIALLSVVPQLQHFFDYSRFKINGVDHTVVGVSKEQTGLRPDAKIDEFMAKAFLLGIKDELKAHPLPE